MTLLEILVAMAIVGTVSVFAVMGIRKLRSSDLRSDAGQLAASLRYAFDRATASGAHHRVVLDVDAGAFRVERCEGEVKLRRSVQEAQEDQVNEVRAQLDEIMKKVEQQAAQSGLEGAPNPGADLAAAAEKLGGARCGPLEGRMGKPRTLRSARGVKVKEVHVQHLPDPVGEGTVTLNFFPSGYAEKAVVVLEDEDGDAVSILVHPITGRVQLQVGELRHADEFITEDALGNEVAE